MRRNLRVIASIRQRGLRRSSTSPTIHHDVAIVGGGPTGMVLGHLLHQYGVDHIVIERRATPTSHPQAHFINARTMEILQSHMPDVFQEIVKDMPPLVNWRDFAYVHQVLGKQLARVDHFEKPAHEIHQKWLYSPSDVVHFPQHSFEKLLSSHGKGNILRSWEVRQVEPNFGGEMGARITMHSLSNQELKHVQAKYVIAADGANSAIRDKLNIRMQGSTNLQSLINVHFSCADLGKQLQPRPAMLYFVFNEHVICVLVVQDIKKGEYVCQIPFFYPHEEAQDYPPERCLKLIKHALGNESLPIEILSIKPWTMHAQVAESFVRNSVILAGDAAHRFPPAGGFGMNTGVQDAHNLAWRLAAILRGDIRHDEMNSYDFERRTIAIQNTELSLTNYGKTVQVASSLGVDPELGKNVFKLASSVLPKSIQKTAIQTLLTAGRAPLMALKSNHNLYGSQRVAILRRQILQGNHLSLLFPAQDVGFRYPVKGLQPLTLGSTSECLAAGRRVPHAWLLYHDNIVLSTVHLPSIFAQIRRFPVFVVICSQSSLQHWRDILAGRENWALASFAEPAGAAVNFLPFQRIAACPSLLGDEQSAALLRKEYQLWAELPALAKVDAVNDTPTVINFARLDNSWFDQRCVERDHQMQFDILLRPDGHILATCDATATQAQREQLFKHVLA